MYANLPIPDASVHASRLFAGLKMSGQILGDQSGGAANRLAESTPPELWQRGYSKDPCYVIADICYGAGDYPAIQPPDKVAHTGIVQGIWVMQSSCSDSANHAPGLETIPRGDFELRESRFIPDFLYNKSIRESSLAHRAGVSYVPWLRGRTHVSKTRQIKLGPRIYDGVGQTVAQSLDPLDLPKLRDWVYGRIQRDG